MDKFSTFLLGAITGAIALGVTACVCESTFSSSPEIDSTDAGEENNGEAENKDKLPPDSAFIVR